MPDIDFDPFDQKCLLRGFLTGSVGWAIDLSQLKEEVLERLPFVGNTACKDTGFCQRPVDRRAELSGRASFSVFHAAVRPHHDRKYAER